MIYGLTKKVNKGTEDDKNGDSEEELYIDYKLLIFNFIYQFVSLYPCALLCYLPFIDKIRLAKRKIATVSALVCVFFAAPAAVLDEMGYAIAAPLIAVLLLSVGFIYYRKTVQDGLNKLLFVFFIVVHTGSMGTELHYSVLTLGNVLGRESITWFALLIFIRILLYLLLGHVIYHVFSPRLKKIKPEDMKGLWILPVFFAAVSIYHGADYYVKNKLDNMFGVLFLVFSVLSFLVYGLLLRTLDSITQNADAKIKEQVLAADNAVLDRLNRMKTELIATVSHETMTPLAVLSGYAELVARELRKKGVDEQTTKDLDKIAEETQRISWLMDELRNHTREENEHLSKIKLNPSKLIDGVARLYTPIMARKSTDMVVRLPAELPDVYACPGEITQVIFNILQNTCNHIENGTVTIDTALDNDYIVVIVSDTGGGIPAELLPRVFERGFSGSNSGSGLGLHICKEIIVNHGGEIDIISEYGKGTTLRFTLPIWKEGMGDDA